MNKMNTSLKLLYEVSSQDQIDAYDMLGVPRDIFDAANTSVLNTISTGHDFNDYLQKLRLALQNVLASKRGSNGIPIDKIADHANLFLKRYKNQIANTILEVYEKQIGYRFFKIPELNNDLLENVVDFNPYIKKLSNEPSLGNITENFITVNSMKLLYESDIQEAYYELDLKRMFADIDAGAEKLKFENVFINENAIKDIHDSHKKGEKEFSIALKTHLRIKSLPNYKYNPSQDLGGLIDLIDEYLRERVKDTIALAYTTSIISNKRYFEENGISLNTGGIEQHVDIIDTPLSVENESLTWADSIVKQYGDDSERLNRVYNDFITDSVFKYLISTSDPMYTSLKDTLIAQKVVKIEELNKKKDNLVTTFNKEINILKNKKEVLYKRAVRKAEKKAHVRTRKLVALRARNSEISEQETDLAENLTKFMQGAGLSVGAVGGILSSYGSISAALSSAGALNIIGGTAAAIVGIPFAVGTGIAIGAGVGYGLGYFNKRSNKIRKLLGNEPKYGKTGVSHSKRVNLDKVFSGDGDDVDIRDKSQVYELEEEYLLIQEAIEEELEQALEKAEDEFMIKTTEDIEEKYADSINQANQFDIDIKKIELKYANQFDLIKRKLLQTPSFLSLRDCISAAVLSVTKLAKRVITPEHFNKFMLDLILESVSSQANADFIKKELSSLGIENVSKEIQQTIDFITRNLFDIKIDGVESIELDEVVQSKTAEEITKVESEPGEPSIPSVPAPEASPVAKTQAQPQELISVINTSGGDTANKFLLELSNNRELQQIILSLIEGQETSYKELLSGIEGSSNNLDGISKAIIKGMQALRENLPPIPLDFAKQIIQDEIGTNKEKIKDIGVDKKPNEVVYRELYIEEDIKPRVALLTQYFKANKSIKEFEEDTTQFIYPQLDNFLSKVLAQSDGDDKKQLKMDYIEDLSIKIVRLYRESTKKAQNDSHTRRNTSIIAERRLQLESDIHNVLYKTWKC